MKCGARVALGVAGGYLLGRTKKMKLALMVAGMAAGRRAGGPGELLKSGTKLLDSTPELARLSDEVRGRLLAAGKNAALAVATHQVESLTDRVGKRVESLGDLGTPRRRADEEPAEDRAEDRAGPDEEERARDTGTGTGTGTGTDTDTDTDTDADTDTGEEQPARRTSRSSATTTPSGRGGKNASTTATARRATSGTGRAARGAAGKGATTARGTGGRSARNRRSESNG